MKISKMWLQYFGLFIVAASLATSLSVDEKLTQLRAHSAPVIKLTSSMYEDLVTAPRSYSIFVTFTAMDPKFGCDPCRAFAPEYELVSKSWHKTTKESTLFFASLDFHDGREIFKKMDIDAVPFIVHFPPTVGPNARPDKMENYRLKDQPNAEDFAEFVSNVAKVQFSVSRPIDLVRAGSILIGVAGLIAIAKLALPKISTIFMRKGFWTTITMVIILTMTTGHMYNRIRGIPYTVAGKGGRPVLIADGYQNQVGIETQIVAILYAFASISVLGLTLQAPKLGPGMQRVAVTCWVLVLVGIASAIMFVFRMKNGGYPFRLLF